MSVAQFEVKPMTVNNASALISERSPSIEAMCHVPDCLVISAMISRFFPQT